MGMRASVRVLRFHRLSYPSQVLHRSVLFSPRIAQVGLNLFRKSIQMGRSRVLLQAVPLFQGSTVE